jgi:hypothetical protein
VAESNHGPNRITNYFETHETIMGQFVDRGFILSDTLEVLPYGARYIVITGSLACLGDIRLDVSKLLEVVDGEGGMARVQTVEYSYNANLPGVGNILRYDSPHPDHNCFHHVHRFDVFDGDREGRAEACEWPHLGDVIGELEAWFYDNYERLNH